MCALTAVLGMVVVAPAFAQDNFPDVPDNHWAYEALENLKREGILVGYPDGLYRGGRPASRYELAIAIHAAYTNLRRIVDGVTGRIDELTQKVDDMAAQLEAADLKGLRDELAALKQQVQGLQGLRNDVDALKKLADEFQKELGALGVDVEAMKKDLTDLEKRVSDLEKRRPAVEISGDVNALILAGHSTDGSFGLTPDRRVLGLGEKGYSGLPVGMTRDLSVLHEAAFTFKGTNEEGPKWRATLVTGNFLSPTGGAVTALGSQGKGAFGAGFTDNVASDVYINELSVSFDTSFAGLNFNAELGRIGYSVNHLLFKRTDYTDYLANSRWDSPNWVFDGGILRFNFGSAKFVAWGGRNSDRLSVNGVPVNAVMVGPTNDNQKSDIDTSLGLGLNIPISDIGALNLAYMWLDKDTPASNLGPTYNRVSVYGGDLSLRFGQFTLKGMYGRTDYQFNTSNVLTNDNEAFEASLGFGGNNYNLELGVRRVEQFYGAPGSWGRLGIVWNPTDVEGGFLNAHIDLSPSVRLSASGAVYAGITPARQDDTYSTVMGQLDFRVNPNWTLMTKVDYTLFDRNIGPDPRQTWFTFGVGYNLGANTTVDVRYTYSDLRDTLSVPYFVTGVNQNRYRGGLLSTQLSIKF